jgi:hypothetical protein
MQHSHPTIADYAGRVSAVMNHAQLSCRIQHSSSERQKKALKTLHRQTARENFSVGKDISRGLGEEGSGAAAESKGAAI